MVQYTYSPGSPNATRQAWTSDTFVYLNLYPSTPYEWSVTSFVKDRITSFPVKASVYRTNSTILTKNQDADISGNSEVKLFPNPASEVIHISTDSEIENVRILTITGTEVNGYSFNKERREIQISKLNAGIYVCVIKTAQGNRSVYFTRY